MRQKLSFWKSWHEHKLVLQNVKKAIKKLPPTKSGPLKKRQQNITHYITPKTRSWLNLFNSDKFHSDKFHSDNFHSDNLIQTSLKVYFGAILTFKKMELGYTPRYRRRLERKKFKHNVFYKYFCLGLGLLKSRILEKCLEPLGEKPDFKLFP